MDTAAGKSRVRGKREFDSLYPHAQNQRVTTQKRRFNPTLTLKIRLCLWMVAAVIWLTIAVSPSLSQSGNKPGQVISIQTIKPDPGKSGMNSLRVLLWGPNGLDKITVAVPIRYKAKIQVGKVFPYRLRLREDGRWEIVQPKGLQGGSL